MGYPSTDWTRTFNYITPTVSTLHWLPVKFHTDYKYYSLSTVPKKNFGLNNPHCLLPGKGAGSLLVPRILNLTEEEGGATKDLSAMQSLLISVWISDIVKCRLNTCLCVLRHY